MEVDISKVSGNASENVKSLIASPTLYLSSQVGGPQGPLFGGAILKRVVVTEVSVNEKAEEPQRLEGRVVCEIEVEEDMVNGGGNIHGGCSAFLIDMCSTMSLVALKLATSGECQGGVSQSLNIVYHSPARVGEKLRLVNTTLTMGARAFSARTEMWSLAHHRLVASGVHIKMQSSSGPKANL